MSQFRYMTVHSFEHSSEDDGSNPFHEVDVQFFDSYMDALEYVEEVIDELPQVNEENRWWTSHNPNSWIRIDKVSL